MAAKSKEEADFDLDGAIVELVSKDAVTVPPYPAVAMKVQQLVRREDFGIDELAKLVQSDQALAVDALRAANAAFYSRGMPVTSLNAAIGRIGAKEVSRLALASGLGTLARKPGPLAALKRRAWLEALASGALAQTLAKKRGLNAEEAFTCGLLHDFGKMIAIACVEQILDQHGAACARPIEFWIEVIDRYHVELGLVLAARWELPPLVADVISLHHGPDAQSAGLPLVQLVTTIDEVVALLNARSGLTAEDLGAISGLAPAECAALASVLEQLPSFIASFEGGNGLPPSGASLIESPSLEQFASGPAKADFEVLISVQREVRKYRATGIAANNLVVTGSAPLQENVLIELKLGSKPPLGCWATAKLSWPEGAGYAVLLQPFALSGSAQAIWKILVAQSAGG
ncbi:MAG TPA: HDOD domain-containing protein [Anaeromyxobacteraceae bacterium]|nr:HDOD domain-containing protein [Anaeromyxobacteraceae bacterium]